MAATQQSSEHTELLPASQRAGEAPVYDAIHSLHTAKPPRNPTRRWLVLLIFVLLVVIATFVGLNVYWVAGRSDDLIGNSVEVEVHNVSLAGVSTKGVDVRVHATALVDYDDIDDNYLKRVIKLGAGLLQTANVKSDSVDLETLVDGKRVRVGTVDVPEIKVNIAHGQLTPVDMIVSIHPDTVKLLGLVKRILTNPEDILKVYGSTALKISLGHIPIGKFDINFEEAIMPNRYFRIDSDDIEIFDCAVASRLDDHTYDVSFMVALPNPVKEKLISFEVPKLHWTVFVNDCYDHPTIGILEDETITTGAFRLSSLDNYLAINVSASISQLNKKLNVPCPQDIYNTPFNKLVTELMNNNTLPIRIQNIGGSKHYPTFMNEILTNNAFDFVYTPQGSSSQLIHNTSLEDLGFEFQDGDFGSPVINGIVSVFIEIPVPGVEDGLGVKSARGLPTLYHQGLKFGEVTLNEWHAGDNEFVIGEDGVEYLHVKITLDQEVVVITDSGVFASVVNDVLLGGGSKILVKSDLDCIVETLIGEFEIDGIHVENESEISIGSLFT